MRTIFSPWFERIRGFFFISGNVVKKALLSLALTFSATFAGCDAAYAQFSVIRGVNPSAAFVNLNADQYGNIQVNCTIGCGASAGTGGLAANGSAASGNPVLTAGWDGTLVRTELTDTSGRQIVSVFSLPALPPGANAIGTVGVTALPSLPTGANAIGTVGVTALPSLPTGANTIGAVTVSGTPTVIATPTSNTLTDHSGTIITGGTSQTISTARARKYLFVQNLSSGALYINFTSAASASSGSIYIPPNGSFVQESFFASSEAITIFGATTGQAFTAKDF
jgi:hypothetical protein